jgi:hypothetical protein
MAAAVIRRALAAAAGHGALGTRCADTRGDNKLDTLQWLSSGGSNWQNHAFKRLAFIYGGRLLDR